MDYSPPLSQIKREFRPTTGQHEVSTAARADVNRVNPLNPPANYTHNYYGPSSSTFFVFQQPGRYAVAMNGQRTQFINSTRVPQAVTPRQNGMPPFGPRHTSTSPSFLATSTPK